jgi:hypothetical protein
MEKREVIYRHSGAVRLTHWVNALVLLVLLMSGLQIFNAHPALYLGSKSDFERPVMAMGAVQDGERVKGVTTVFGHAFDTTGAFGLAGDAENGYEDRGFPLVVDASRPPRSRHGPALAFLLRLALSLQWPCLSPVEPRQRPSSARPRTLGQGAKTYRRIHLGACAA